MVKEGNLGVWIGSCGGGGGEQENWTVLQMAHSFLVEALSEGPYDIMRTAKNTSLEKMCACVCVILIRMMWYVGIISFIVTE